MNPYNKIKEAETVDTARNLSSSDIATCSIDNTTGKLNKNSKIEWISVLRAFSCMAVVMIHVINIRI